MKLILTRHGQTEENVQNLLQGWTPGILTKLGVEQAKKLALRLKDEKIDAIFCSDLKRATYTAAEIIKFHDCPVYYVKELREGATGSWTGKSKALIDWKNRPKDMETRGAMRTRIKSLLDRVYAKYPEGNVLFVGHTGINQVLLTIIYGVDVSEMDNLDTPPQTSVTIFEILEDKKHKVHCLNCVKHLS